MNNYPHYYSSPIISSSNITLNNLLTSSATVNPAGSDLIGIIWSNTDYIPLSSSLYDDSNGNDQSTNYLISGDRRMYCFETILNWNLTLTLTLKKSKCDPWTSKKKKTVVRIFYLVCYCRESNIRTTKSKHVVLLDKPQVRPSFRYSLALLFSFMFLLFNFHRRILFTTSPLSFVLSVSHCLSLLVM